MPKCVHKQSIESVVSINQVVHESSQQQTKVISGLNEKICIESILEIFEMDDKLVIYLKILVFKSCYPRDVSGL